ncbi:envelope glycoprotein H [Testudinid alphaherpesvirus 3]|uniref:Envelope glycoprotein H n=1 Tax=Testudinid alphaherpesvirus 3 TaxID=2560801 RepID=A0A0K1R1A8_9ALPH|nr:envelope glycoprotein H [Testudinid alphaherpesvirus 3]AIU39273.1 envelope glycoprotein H [Testudinid alphaherpesvirus 3]AIU39383.1 envelope glycoprotein H [Testudinid alphaherpesvirus 3]AKI81659.1 envelope glycoprotein H [Testudinid alphaherpesvirus 3]AKI81762.1 envelope glycoprotein H [Testudinid alphaherpesvirus 3]AKV40694.1 UL22 glycoprotein H [Testudinid alphaherpesvirus 3]
MCLLALLGLITLVSAQPITNQYLRVVFSGNESSVRDNLEFNIPISVFKNNAWAQQLMEYSPFDDRHLATHSWLRYYRRIKTLTESDMKPVNWIGAREGIQPPSKIITLTSTSDLMNEDPLDIGIRTSSFNRPDNVTINLENPLFYPNRLAEVGTVNYESRRYLVNNVIGKDMIMIRFSNRFVDFHLFIYNKNKNPIQLRFLNNTILKNYTLFESPSHTIVLFIADYFFAAPVVSALGRYSLTFLQSDNYQYFLSLATQHFLDTVSKTGCKTISGHEPFMGVMTYLTFAMFKFSQLGQTTGYYTGEEILDFYTRAQILADMISRCHDRPIPDKDGKINTIRYGWSAYSQYAKLVLDKYNRLSTKDQLDYNSSEFIAYMRLLFIDAFSKSTQVIKSQVPQGFGVYSYASSVYSNFITTQRLSQREREGLYLALHTGLGNSTDATRRFRRLLMETTSMCTLKEMTKSLLETETLLGDTNGHNLLGYVSPCLYGLRFDVAYDVLQMQVLTLLPPGPTSQQSSYYTLGKDAERMLKSMMEMNAISMSQLFPELSCLDITNTRGLLAVIPITHNATFLISSAPLVRAVTFPVGDTVVSSPLYVSFVNRTCIPSRRLIGTNEIRSNFELRTDHSVCSVCGVVIVKYSETFGFREMLYIDSLATQNTLFHQNATMDNPFMATGPIDQSHFLLLFPNGTVVRLSGLMEHVFIAPIKEIAIIITSVITSIAFLAFVLKVCINK